MKTKQLKVLFAAAELTPLVKVGGLADVAGSLPKALKKMGIDIKIVIPKYEIIDSEKYPMKKISEKIRIFFEGEEEFFNLYFTLLPGTKIPVYLIDHPKFLGGDGVYYSSSALSTGTITEAHRFIFFTRAILEIFQPLQWQPDIFHCHDWHGALPLLVEMKNQEFKTLLTIHNFAYQGSYNIEAVLKMLNSTKEKNWPTLKIRDRWGNFNSLQQGILNADLINTVSPTYAKEILTKEYGCDLEETLKKRKKDLSGILNGLDLEYWNPATDLNIKKNYELTLPSRVISRKSQSSPALLKKTPRGEGMTKKSSDLGEVKIFEAKKENKIYLQKVCKLPVNPDIPLIGLISRIAEQKGFDLISEVFDEIMKLDLQFVLLGVGDSRMEKFFEEKTQEYPQKFSLHLKFDAKLAQQIYAGSDMFLMPSRFEPCGLGQMISMRYGTIPIVRKTGGLADTVSTIKCQMSNIKCEGTGFVFEKYKAKEMLKAIKRTLKIYQNKKIWHQLIINAMKQNFSWDSSARKYLQLYRHLMNSTKKSI